MTIFNIPTVYSGGIGQKSAILMLRLINVEAKPCVSAYVGMTAVSVQTRNKRTLERIERTLYGN